MAKYTTLTQLAAAFKSGELDSSYYLMIDKGGASLTLRQTGQPGEFDEEIDRRCDKCAELFKRPYGDPTEELLQLAGIRSENC